VARFALVNLVAATQVWLVTISLYDWLFPRIGFAWHAGSVAHGIGVASPVLTSYLGHRFFTFRKAPGHAPANAASDGSPPSARTPEIAESVTR
jgi:putative flippase GtrA